MIDSGNVLTTYKNWLEHSEVINVVITNKRNGTGYLRFDNGLFITLHDKNKFGFDGETKRTKRTIEMFDTTKAFH